jgi:salicylate hydroxylase
VRVIIAGGGTGGLATAIALRKAGIEPLVLEQAPAFTAILFDFLPEADRALADFAAFAHTVRAD